MNTRNIRGRVGHDDGASESGLEFITVIDRDFVSLRWLIHDARFLLLLIILSLLRFLIEITLRR